MVEVKGVIPVLSPAALPLRAHRLRPAVPLRPRGAAETHSAPGHRVYFPSVRVPGSFFLFFLKFFFFCGYWKST